MSVMLGARVHARLCRGFPQVENGVRANGLSKDVMLGLLSAIVGLLRSCVDYQEVIDFDTVVSDQ
ncbi:protein of unknown function [Nitrospira japonica]|uniref:Uncharacterized protein n=1 Tax=Nitrospira japonica TaxID=1325564 RepID=A0A1W1I4L7_9BACT|nr:protein of unknown function [Nitrospira japonica]